MAKTVLTSSAAYATTTQLLETYDLRRVGDLISTNGARATVSEIGSSPVALRGLKWGSSQIEMAALVGKKYLPEDLNALLTDGGVGSDLLIGLNCDLAFWFYLKYRYPGIDQTEVYKSSMEQLQLLRDGARIFSFEENADSNSADARSFTNEDYRRLTLVTGQARRYFGIRGRTVRATRGF